MDAYSVLRGAQAPPSPPIAIVAGERLLFANAQLADLTGYTVNELTSPEFRFSYLFTAEAPLLVGFAPGETRRVAAKVVPLRGEVQPVAVTLQLVSQHPQESFLALFEPGGVSGTDASASERASLSLVQGLRSAIAREAGTLRRLQERAAALELAPPASLARALAQLALMHEELARLESSRARLERHVSAMLPPR